MTAGQQHLLGAQLALITALPPPTPQAGPDTAWTPPWLATRLVGVLVAAGLRGPAWEAHAGGGAFVEALRARRIPVVASDIDPALPWRTWDQAAGLPPGMERPRAMVGNPPWSKAPGMLASALRDVDELIGRILPGDILHRHGWRPVLQQAWPDQVIALGRVTYGGPGRDHGSASAMTDSAFYIWRRGRHSWQGRGIARRMVGQEELWP